MANRSHSTSTGCSCLTGLPNCMGSTDICSLNSWQRWDLGEIEFDITGYFLTLATSCSSMNQSLRCIGLDYTTRSVTQDIKFHLRL